MLSHAFAVRWYLAATGIAVAGVTWLLYFRTAEMPRHHISSSVDESQRLGIFVASGKIIWIAGAQQIQSSFGDVWVERRCRRRANLLGMVMLVPDEGFQICIEKARRPTAERVSLWGKGHSSSFVELENERAGKSIFAVETDQWPKRMRVEVLDASDVTSGRKVIAEFELTE